MAPATLHPRAPRSPWSGPAATAARSQQRATANQKSSVANCERTASSVCTAPTPSRETETRSRGCPAAVPTCASPNGTRRALPRPWRCRRASAAPARYGAAAVSGVLWRVLRQHRRTPPRQMRPLRLSSNGESARRPPPGCTFPVRLYGTSHPEASRESLRLRSYEPLSGQPAGVAAEKTSGVAERHPDLRDGIGDPRAGIAFFPGGIDQAEGALWPPSPALDLAGGGRSREALDGQLRPGSQAIAVGQGRRIRPHHPGAIELRCQLLVGADGMKICEPGLGQPAGVIECHVVVEARIEVDEQVFAFVLDELALEHAGISQRTAEADQARFQVGQDVGMLEEEPDAQIAGMREHLEHGPGCPALPAGCD